jgi:rhodanese-related sulfurtransferase
MNSVFDFITHHWILAVLFVLAFIWLILEEAFHQGMGGARQTPQGVTNLMNRENAVVVDLREPNAYGDGHIVGSINIPAARLDSNLNKLEKYKAQPIVLVCPVGQHSVKAMNKLKKNGYDKVYVLGGGLGAWKSAGLPLVKK